MVSPPSNALRPVSISKSTQPKDQMSVRRSTGFPRACSGLMYAAVPRIVPRMVIAGYVSVGELAGLEPGLSLSLRAPGSVGANIFANPKSRTLSLPSGRTLMFAGLRSRCTTPRSCAASSASAIWREIDTTSSKSIGPRAMRSASVSPSTSSMTMASRTWSDPERPDSSTPYTAAMFGWFSAARSSASRWKRAM